MQQSHPDPGLPRSGRQGEEPHGWSPTTRVHLRRHRTGPDARRCVPQHERTDVLGGVARVGTGRGALVGYVIFTLGLGIGDTDIFDWGGLLSALIGTLIVLGLAGYFLRRRQPGQRLPPGRPETTGRDRCREPEPVRIQLLLDRTQPDLGKRRRPADCPAWQVYSPEGPSRACGARCWHLPPDPCGMVAVCSAASVAPAGEDARWNVGVGTR
jgi:hypothetical protein